MFCEFNIVPKILDLISNIKNVIFFKKNKWQCVVVFKKRN